MVVRESRSIGKHGDLRSILTISIDLIAAFAAWEVICTGGILEPEARNIKGPFQGNLFNIIMNVVHHHLELLCLQERDVDGFVELLFGSFEDNGNNSAVLIEYRDGILSEIPGVIIAQVRPDTEKKSVLGKRVEDLIQNLRHFLIY